MQAIFDTYSGSTTIAGLIRKQAERQLELDELNGKPYQFKNFSPRVETGSDRLNRIHDETADDFTESCKSAFVVFPRRGTATDEINDILQKLGFKTRMQLSRKQSSYFIVGSDKEHHVTVPILDKLKDKFGFRPFQRKQAVA
jgi:hypothetical protein